MGRTVHSRVEIAFSSCLRHFGRPKPVIDPVGLLWDSERPRAAQVKEEHPDEPGEARPELDLTSPVGEEEPSEDSEGSSTFRGSSMVRRLLGGPVVGDRVGEYTLERQLGAGGMGEVFEARHVQSGERVALKLLRAASATRLLRFKREYRAVARIRHENLVELGELVVNPGELAYFTMEVVEGERFTSYIRRRAASRQLPSLARLRHTLRQLVRGVVHLHAHGRLHRDLKPSNVLVTGEGRVVILDFGLIAEFDEGEAGPTQTGQVLGTPNYMAPEQAGFGEIGPAADAYAIGVMLFEALCGERPFTGAAKEVVRAKLELDPPELASRVEGTPADLRELCAGLLARAPDQRPQLTTVLEGLEYPDDAGSHNSILQRSEPLPTEVFGRRDELAQLSAVLGQVESDASAVTVHLRGASGQGKSFVINHFLAGLRGRAEITILRGRCYESESMPFKGIDSLIDSLSIHLHHLPQLELAGLRPRYVDALTQLFPTLEGLWPAGRSRAKVELLERRRRGLSALRELLVRMSEASTLVVFIDDFQWADVDSARLLTELVRPPDPPVMLLIVAFRTKTQADSARGEGPLSTLMSSTNMRLRDVRDIELRPLSEQSGAAFARALMTRVGGEGTQMSEEEALAYARSGRGSPFYIRQLVLDARAPQTYESHASLDRVVARRVLALDGECRRLLSAIAVAGGPLPLEVGLDASELVARFELVEQLSELDLITHHGAQAKDMIEAAHDRIREVVVGELDADEIRGLHLALAQAFERYGSSPERLAVHYEQGGEPELAIGHAELAALRAASALAFERAASFYRRALELLPAKASTEHRSRLELGLAEQLDNLGHAVEAAELFVGLGRRASGAPTIDYERRAAEQLLKSGQVDAGLSSLRAALASTGDRLPQQWLLVRLQIVWHRSWVALRGLEFELRDPSTVDPLALRRLDTLVAGLIGLSQREVLLTHALHARLLRISLEVGVAYYLMFAFSWEAIYAVLRGRDERSEMLLDICRKTAESSGDAQVLGLLDFMVVVIDWVRRDWQTSVPGLEQILLMIEGTPRLGFLTGWRPRMAFGQVELGGLALLRPKLPGWTATALERGNRQEVAEIVAVTSMVELMFGGLEEARRLLEEARGYGDEPRYTHTKFFLDYAEASLLLDEGRVGEAALLSERALNEARRWRLSSFPYLMEGLHDLRGRSFARVAIGRPGERRARRMVRRSARLLRRRGRGVGEAQAAVLSAALASLDGDLARTLHCWQEAERAFARVGMRAHRAAVCMRLGTQLEEEAAARYLGIGRSYFMDEGIERPERIVERLAPAVCSTKEKGQTKS